MSRRLPHQPSMPARLFGRYVKHNALRGWIRGSQCLDDCGSGHQYSALCLLGERRMSKARKRAQELPGYGLPENGLADG